MIRPALLLLVSGCGCCAATSWVACKTGPFVVYSDTGARTARERLAEWEQFRFSLGELLGKHDLTVRPGAEWIVSGTGSATDPVVTRTRTFAWTGNSASRKSLAKLLLEQNVGRLPERLERGLETFLSTTEVNGAKVTWGAPPPAAERNADWALVEWLVTNPDTYGKFRVLLANLQTGMDEEVAYRNSIGRSREEVAHEVTAFTEAGRFHTITAPSRPLSPERDLVVKSVPAEDMELVFADLLDGSSEGRYRSLLNAGHYTVEAEEGLAMLAIRRNDLPEARELLGKAIAGGSQNAAAMVAYARIETAPEKAADALRRAIGIDAGSAEGHFLLGQLATDSRVKVQEWTLATKLDPRREEYWTSLAQLLVEQKQWADAAKAWRGAEQAATDPADRERMLQNRLALETQRLDFEAAEQRDAEARKQAEIDRLKAEARAEIRAAEAKANSGRSDESAKAVSWEELNGAQTHVEGTLLRIECVAKQVRLVIRAADGATIKLSATGVDDPSIRCGAPPKECPITVDYNPKRNARSGVVGEAVAIQFPK